MTRAEIRAEVGVEPRQKLPKYSSVGCYPILYVGDGEAFCADCALRNAPRVHKVDCYWEGLPYECDDCGEEVESAYGDPEENAYPVEVYCSEPDCMETAQALCGHDKPTCYKHGSSHTCGTC